MFQTTEYTKRHLDASANTILKEYRRKLEELLKEVSLLKQLVQTQLDNAELLQKRVSLIVTSVKATNDSMKSFSDSHSLNNTALYDYVNSLLQFSNATLDSAKIMILDTLERIEVIENSPTVPLTDDTTTIVDQDSIDSTLEAMSDVVDEFPELVEPFKSAIEGIISTLNNNNDVTTEKAEAPETLIESVNQGLTTEVTAADIAGGKDVDIVAESTAKATDVSLDNIVPAESKGSGDNCTWLGIAIVETMGIVTTTGISVSALGTSIGAIAANPALGSVGIVAGGIIAAALLLGDNYEFPNAVRDALQDAIDDSMKVAENALKNGSSAEDAIAAALADLHTAVQDPNTAVDSMYNQYLNSEQKASLDNAITTAINDMATALAEKAAEDAANYNGCTGYTCDGCPSYNNVDPDCPSYSCDCSCDGYEECGCYGYIDIPGGCTCDNLGPPVICSNDDDCYTCDCICDGVCSCNSVSCDECDGTPPCDGTPCDECDWCSGGDKIE